jgi:hypothetical protein
MGNFQYIANRLSTRSPGFLPFCAEPMVTQAVPLSAEPSPMDYSFSQNIVFSLTPIHLPVALRSPRVLVAIIAGVSAGIGVGIYAVTRRKPTAEEIERERRELLARSGRITDGTIMDTMVTEARNSSLSGDDLPPTPQIILYNYRIAGVTYECAQDVTMLAEYVHGIRTDLPVQVRYLPQNPANSIVVAESWSGLRLGSSPPHQGD